MSAYRPTMPQEIKDLVTDSGGDRLNAALKAAYCAGWTLQELADITGVSRERVRQRTNKRVPVSVMDEIEGLIPAKPSKPTPAPAPRQPKPISFVAEEVLTTIKELQEKSSGVNGSTPVGAPSRVAGDLLCKFVKAVMDEYGVSVGDLARAIGLDRQTLSKRLAARGLIHRSPSVREYKNTTRIAGRPKAATCLRGHDTSYPEARELNGKGNCKQCHRDRKRAAYAKTKAA